MDSETREDTIVEVLRNHPPLASEMGNIVTAIRGAISEGRYPWIRIESLALAATIIQLLSHELTARISGKVVQPHADLEEIDLERLSSASEKSGEIDAHSTRTSIEKILEESNVTRVKRVWGEGEYAIIGDTITVWPSGYSAPVRIEFEDDRLTQINLLETQTWRTRRSLPSVTLFSMSGSERADEPETVDIIGGEYFNDTLSKGIFISETGILPPHLQEHVRVIHVDMRQTSWGEGIVKNRLKDGWAVILGVHTHGENAERIKSGFPGIQLVDTQAEVGFESVRMKTMVLTDQELWGTVRLTSGMSRSTYSDLLLDEISPGDYVVHEDHGVGLYAGIEKQDRNGVEMKYLELKYAQKDRLLVPLSQLKKVTKYVGVGAREPKLTRLGGGEWRRVKKRVSAAVRKLAGELLRLYAARELASTRPISESTIDISAFEKDFPFVETEDQLRAVEDIKQDLQGDRPMDRVLVGDVGFGKTEVAMRAAYMIARTGKQVAVLAPTTVLVEQHYRVFRDRFEKHGIRVEGLSRFLTKDEAADIVSQVKSGKVDIVVGTHRLLSNDVGFNDLGMIIIDEEQKFGVAQKEKLKKARLEAHVLSMSATPIPRTLNMTLAGVRDISIIATPPEGRLPIQNIVEKFDWKRVKEAIHAEVAREGQVYFVHNRVTTIETLRNKMSEMMPDVRIGVGHGQMSGAALSKVMRDFHEGVFDVLLCTTIIENGLDMANVNTLIVDRAEMFGLSQLYQIRGRIGRGDRQAYAYFLYHGSMGGRFVKQAMLERVREEPGAVDEDGFPAVKPVLWEAARRRLDAIDQLQDLGSGFALAQRDLEIRGAGNFLGREQHGNVSAVGFSLYCRLLDEMIREMKQAI